MTKRRPIIAAAFALATLAGGVVAASSVGAQRIPSMVNRSTTTKPRTVTTPMPPLPPRTKNAALPTTVAPKTITTAPKTSTTKPRTVTTPMPTLNTITRTKNAALPTTTVAPKGKGKGKGKATITMPAYGG